MKKPSGHDLYWVYIYDRHGAYSFDTAPRMSDAKKILTGLKKEWISGGVPAHEAFIFYGDKNGAFTNLDPVVSWHAT